MNATPARLRYTAKKGDADPSKLVIGKQVWYNGAENPHVPEVRPCTVSLYVKTIPAPRNRIKPPPAVSWREKAVSQGWDYDIDVFHTAPPLMERLAKYSDAYPLSLLDIQLDGDNGVELARFLRENKVNAASISRQPEILRRLHGPVCGIPKKELRCFLTRKRRSFSMLPFWGAAGRCWRKRRHRRPSGPVRSAFFKSRVGYSRPHMGYRR